MEEAVFQSVMKEGAWALLFVWLLYTTMKKSGEREDRLMAHVEKTTETLDDIRDSLRDLRIEVDEIKSEISKG